MNIAKKLLHWAGWRFDVNVDLPAKCIICVAPHTSNWDFILGELASRSVGIKAKFLMKKAWFVFPIGYLMRALGGIPIDRSHHTNVTTQVAEQFDTSDQLVVAVTPEGTRSGNDHWHTGFLRIAHQASVPVLLAYIDYPKRLVCIDRVFNPSDDIDADLNAVKEYYSLHADAARHPNQFAI